MRPSVLLVQISAMLILMTHSSCKESGSSGSESGTPIAAGSSGGNPEAANNELGDFVYGFRRSLSTPEEKEVRFEKVNLRIDKLKLKRKSGDADFEIDVQKEVSSFAAKLIIDGCEPGVEYSNPKVVLGSGSFVKFKNDRGKDNFLKIPLDFINAVDDSVTCGPNGQIVLEFDHPSDQVTSFNYKSTRVRLTQGAPATQSQLNSCDYWRCVAKFRLAFG